MAKTIIDEVVAARRKGDEKTAKRMIEQSVSRSLREQRRARVRARQSESEALARMRSGQSSDSDNTD